MKLPLIVTKKIKSVNTILHIFSSAYHILSRMGKRRKRKMRETDDRTADIEDLLYDEDGGYPSER